MTASNGLATASPLWESPNPAKGIQGLQGIQSIQGIPFSTIFDFLGRSSGKLIPSHSEGKCSVIQPCAGGDSLTRRECRQAESRHSSARVGSLAIDFHGQGVSAPAGVRRDRRGTASAPNEPHTVGFHASHIIPEVRQIQRHRGADRDEDAVKRRYLPG